MQALPDKPEETAVATLRALWHLAAGEPLSARRGLAPRAAVRSTPMSARLLRDLVARRLSGMPLAYLTERQSFMDIEMIAGPDALIPRVRDGAAGRALRSALLHELTRTGERVIVVDACTGSGNLAARTGARRTWRHRVRIGPFGRGGRARAPEHGVPGLSRTA